MTYNIPANDTSDSGLNGDVQGSVKYDEGPRSFEFTSTRFEGKTTGHVRIDSHDLLKVKESITVMLYYLHENNGNGTLVAWNAISHGKGR